MNADELLKAAKQVPPELMQAMSQQALSVAHEGIAQLAREMADKPGTELLSGPEALRVFANAILSTNRAVFGGKA